MARADWYVSAKGTLRTRPLFMLVDEALKVRIDWNPYLGPKSSSISSVAYDCTDTNLAISSATVASGVSTVTMTASSEGRATVKVSATLDTGEVLVRKFFVTIRDPNFSTSLSDYKC